MSQFGNISDACEALWRTVITSPGLGAGTVGFERVIRSGVDEANRPHVYSFRPIATRRPFDGGARESTIVIQFEYWPARDKTQEEVAVQLDAFVAAVDADPTLGGLAGLREAWVSRYGIWDTAATGHEDRLGYVAVSAVVEE